MASHLAQEDGFSVVEIMIALVIIGIIVLMTVGPTQQSYNLLLRSESKTVQTNIAQGRIEEVRSLEYKDVGYTSALPAGVLEPTETVTVSGVGYDIQTDISYFGSAAGDDVIPQGGDGVQGHYDSGIDFKEVVVTVSRTDGKYKPVEMRTIIAPPSLAANDGLANVIVDLTKFEPSGKDASILPFPKVWLVLDDESRSVSLGGSASAEQVFVGIDSNTDAAPGYYYYGRLGGHLSDLSSATVHWYLYPEDVESNSDRVHVAPTETATMNLRIYLPAEIHVILQDASDGSPVTAGGTLALTGPTGPHTYTQLSPEWNGSGWDITDMDGFPVVPGVYSFDVKMLGYSEVFRDDVTVPDGYPDDRSHDETFDLTAAVGHTLTVHVVDALGVKLGNVDVDVTDLTGTASYVTDLTGTASAFVEGVNPAVTVSVSSNYGHSPATQAVVMTGDTVLTIALGTPSGYGLITFVDSNLGVEHYEYLPRHGNPDDTIFVSANSDGQGSAAVPSGNWTLSKVCTDTSTKRANRVSVPNGGTVTWSTDWRKTCPAP